MPNDIASLVQEYQKYKAFVEQQETALREHLKPSRQRMEQIQAEVTSLMTAQGIKSFKTDHGTPILSEIDTMKIKSDERDAYIDMCLEHWDEFGGEMLQIGAPKVDAVRSYMDAHNGMLPPHVEKETTLRFSVRKA